MVMKRKSLQELQLEELAKAEKEANVESSAIEKGQESLEKKPPKKQINMKKDIVNNNSVLSNSNSDKRNKKSEIIYNKSEYIKMSVTIDPQMFEEVDEDSRQRRKNREPYSYSVIVREALELLYSRKQAGKARNSSQRATSIKTKST